MPSNWSPRAIRVFSLPQTTHLLRYACAYSVLEHSLAIAIVKVIEAVLILSATQDAQGANPLSVYG